MQPAVSCKVHVSFQPSHQLGLFNRCWCPTTIILFLFTNPHLNRSSFTDTTRIICPHAHYHYSTTYQSLDTTPSGNLWTVALIHQTALVSHIAVPPNPIPSNSPTTPTHPAHSLHSNALERTAVLTWHPTPEIYSYRHQRLKSLWHESTSHLRGSSSSLRYNLT